jgi:hypothetical protein
MWRALKIAWRIAWGIIELAVVLYVLGAIKDRSTGIVVSGAARQAGRWEGEGGPQRRGGDSQTALARAGCGRPLGVPSLEQPRRIHAPLKVKERHPSERQVCEIRPGLYPLRARQNAGEKNGRTNADLAEANQEATARQLGEMAAAWL